MVGPVTPVMMGIWDRASHEPRRTLHAVTPRTAVPMISRGPG
jgi:hypothetical protein